jgi:hypothetical protein
MSAKSEQVAPEAVAGGQSVFFVSFLLKNASHGAKRPFPSSLMHEAPPRRLRGERAVSRSLILSRPATDPRPRSAGRRARLEGDADQARLSDHRRVTEGDGCQRPGVGTSREGQGRSTPGRNARRANEVQPAQCACEVFCRALGINRCPLPFNEVGRKTRRSRATNIAGTDFTSTKGNP